MTSTLNFLVSSAGRRGELVNILREVVKLRGGDGGVFAVDRSRLTAAGWLADGLDTVPSIDEPGYIEALLEVCERRRITHLVPTIDTELPVLASARDQFASLGVDVWVSSPETVAIAQDKRLTNAWLGQHGFPRVDQVDLAKVGDWGALSLPRYAKPARGSSSVGLRIVDSPAEIASLDATQDYVLEEIARGVEFTVDVLVDGRGRCRCAVPRQRLETRAGEVSKARTVRDPKLVELATSIADTLPGAYAILNVQIFRSPEGEMRVIEVNARLGGGFPLTWAAGAKMPLWLVEETPEFDSDADLDWREDQVMLRYDAAVHLDWRSRT